MADYETDRLADLIQRKLRCLERLSEMGGKQLEIVSKGSMAALLDVLAAKQRVLNELQQVERALDPFRRQDPPRRTWRSPEKRRQCAAMIDACEELLSRIVAQEKRSEHDLIVRRDEAADKLQKAHVAGRARQAYTERTTAGPSRIDLSSET